MRSDDLDRESAPRDSAAGAASAVAVRSVSKRFGTQQVLDRVSFEIAEREVLVLLGPSGSGKTTLLKILAGLLPPDAGEVRLGGRPADAISPQDRRFGVVFQEQALFRRMTAEENIAFGLRVHRASTARVRERLDGMLDLMGLRAHRAKYPAQLSAGQRQRVALARALAFGPRAMLLDEPFSALDAATRVSLRREVRRILQAVGIPALFITHDQEEALELADRILVLNGGRIEQAGTPFELYNQPRNEFVATFLGAANVLLGSWAGEAVLIGPIRLRPPSEMPVLREGQPVKIVFRPEDVVVSFHPHLLQTPLYLGGAVVDSVSYIGPTERLFVRLLLSPRADAVATGAGGWGGTAAQGELLNPGVITDIGGFPITMTRTKWEATDMELSAGDAVVIGLKDYRLLPHYPLRSESGAKVI